ncbi:hypothetical protein BgAZ_500050 [Babesia gibsoni]|uniref:SRCR domain-containing protein n=1 Tax=Babesia gibsoni TaxID=33632 RepID=A0AAD8LHX2_BABGI|nr:hypothetical protein BgAZ_500020 [Babesia gibsoni]KAK1441673.1 hypothetical protein BgAZ_500050 [Babesia gibsoni]
MVVNASSEGRSLMDFPRSIKECIDWLIHIHHSDNGTHYFATVLRTELSAMGLRGVNIENDVKKLLEGLNEFIGYNGYNHHSPIKGTGIGNKEDPHFSSLSDEHITRLTTLAQSALSEHNSSAQKTISCSPRLLNLLKSRVSSRYNNYKNVNKFNRTLDNLTKHLNPSEETTLRSVPVGPGTQSLFKYISGIYSGYVSVYRNGADWSEICNKRFKGGTNTCCDPPCSECGCSSDSPWTMCCYNCPRRICGRVFLALFPVLLVAFFKLYHSIKGLNTGTSRRGRRLRKHNELLQQFGYDDTDVLMTLDTISVSLRRYHTVTIPLHDAYTYLNKIWESMQSSFKTNNVRRLTVSPSLGPTIASSKPSTIREKLIWTMGLPFTPSFGGLLKHIAGALATLNLEFHMFMKLFSEFLIDIARIFYRLESSTSYLLTDMSKHVFRSSSAHDASCFLYDLEPASLIQNLLSYAKDIFETFTFLRLQCNVDSLNGGWKCCHFGSEVQCDVSDYSKKVMCQCDSKGQGNSCQSPLQAFLTSNREAKFWNKTAFGFTGSKLVTGKKFLDCRWLDGFSHQLSQKGRVNEKGSKGKPKAKVPALKTLCQWLIALTHREPECLGDYIAFFQEFRESGEHSSVDSHCLFERPVFSNGALVNGHSTLTSLLSGELKCSNGSDHHVVVDTYPTHVPSRQPPSNTMYHSHSPSIIVIVIVNNGPTDCIIYQY